MQISAITGNYYTNNYSSAVSKQTENISAAFTSSFEKELFANIIEWKTFCQEQILNNNIDYIA